MLISRSGFAKRASTCADCWDAGVRARFLVGRCERRSADVGMDSGIGSDILAVELLYRRMCKMLNVSSYFGDDVEIWLSQR